MEIKIRQLIFAINIKTVIATKYKYSIIAGQRS